MGTDKTIKVVVVGGGTAGWMTATGLVSLLGPALDITLVESEAIGIVGVGEATLPHLRHFNKTIGIDERAFMAATSATVKLGIEFADWGRKGDAYIHPFGDFGAPSDGVPFHHFWRRAGEAAGRLGDYSLPVVMSYLGKFTPPAEDPNSLLSSYRWAYQFDATAFAPFLRQMAETRGVTRVEGRIVGTTLNDKGDVASVMLEDGRALQADLFVDCSGFRGLLIEDALGTGYEEWTHWLPCDRAIAAPCEHQGPLLPYTRATAREAGWQWRIPLQHRTGNGHVYASGFLSDQEAEDRLVTSLEGKPLADPRQLRFVTGKRRKLWNRNVVAVGLAGGFLEPLESTSIYLIQQGITYLIELLSDDPHAEAPRREYNRMMDLEFERIRDFLILHYHATEREDTEFWRTMKNLDVPDSLKQKMELFRAHGRIASYDHGLFLPASWLAVYEGQRILPDGYDPRALAAKPDEVARGLLGLKSQIAAAAARMPSHEAWIAENCPAATPRAA